MKSLRISVFSVLALMVILASGCIVVFAMFSGSENENPETSILFFDFSLYITYALLLASILVAIVFPLIHMFRNIGKSKRTLAGIVLMLIVFSISFLLSPAYSGDLYTRHGIGPAESRFINAGIITMYLFFIAMVAVFVYAEIAKRLK